MMTNKKEHPSNDVITADLPPPPMEWTRQSEWIENLEFFLHMILAGSLTIQISLFPVFLVFNVPAFYRLIIVELNRFICFSFLNASVSYMIKFQS